MSTASFRPDSDLLAGPPATLLPENVAAQAAMADEFADARAIAAAHPGYAAAWASLAETALRAHDPVAAYAYARTGYHRSLDLLRRSGWKGHGPVPWEHEPNRGFLRCLRALAQAATAIGEEDEATRCTLFLRESSPAAADALEGR